jgi:prolyl-tRNA editing enzyme YbaK/EbsC (Cys-tRNA(Pro) deacylase)
MKEIVIGEQHMSVEDNQPIGSSATKVQAALRAAGLGTTVVEMPASTRTAKEAAQAIGCTVGQIAKSLVFRASGSNSAILVIASGTNRVNEGRLAALVGEPIERATPEFVRERTGFVIGGVPPIGHPSVLRTWMDRDLLQYENVWAAAGTPFAVFAITPGELQRVTGAVVVEVK